jgi:hypothetical protein
MEKSKMIYDSCNGMLFSLVRCHLHTQESSGDITAIILEKGIGSCSKILEDFRTNFHLPIEIVARHIQNTLSILLHSQECLAVVAAIVFKLFYRLQSRKETEFHQFPCHINFPYFQRNFDRFR